MALMRRDRSLQFALNHHRNVRGEPLEFSDRFYMLEILSDVSPEQVVMSAVQTGKTEAWQAKLMADCSLGMSSFYVLPTQDSRNVFVHNRVDRLLKVVPAYREMLANSVAGTDSVLLKHIGPGTVRFGASNSLNEFKEFPADSLYVDEFDQCDPAGISYAEDRTKGSPYRYKHILSNPSLPGSEGRQNIDWMFQNSDQKRIYYECTQCGLLQPMSWWHNVVRKVFKGGVLSDYVLRDEEWETGCGRDVHSVCMSCGSVIDRKHDCVGWVPEGDPRHRVSGFHITRLNVPSDEIEELYLRFRRSVGNPSAMQTFVNSDLGLAFEGGAGSQVTEELIGSCSEPYFVPEEAQGPCTMGVDVGGRMVARISDYVSEQVDDVLVRRRRLIHVGEYETIEELFTVAQRFRVTTCVIDSEPEIRMAKEFQKRAPFKVWRCKFHTTEGGNPRPVRWDTPKKKAYERMVWVDRTEAMDSVYADYVSRRVAIPSAFASLVEGRWLRQMTAPIRTFDSDKGRYYWIKTVDHAYLADVYDWLAGQDPMAGFIMRHDAIVRGQKASYDRVYQQHFNKKTSPREKGVGSERRKGRKRVRLPMKWGD